jgi:N-acetylglucosaminyl-diphospho-decaprenol L-rhamnosyltransferase
LTSRSEHVAVVVVTYHSERLLPDLFASLGPGMAGVPWHLTVADNASGDGTVAAVRRLAPEATVVEMGGNRGYAAGINAAVGAAEPFTAILVLNPDVRLAPGAGRELLATLRTPGTGIAAPRLTDGERALIPSLRREPSVLRALGDALLGAGRAGRFPLLGEVVTGAEHYAAPTSAAWAEGSSLMISADCWRACGGWDESFFLYSEETDFALRARDAGFATRFTPRARAVHLGGDYGPTGDLWVLLTLNRLRLYRRRHGRFRGAGFWGALLLRELTRAAVGREHSWAATRALLSSRPHHRRVRPASGQQSTKIGEGLEAGSAEAFGQADRAEIERPAAAAPAQHRSPQ